MFRPMWSSSGIKIIGRGNCCFLLLLMSLSPLDPHVCSSWWVVFPPVVFVLRVLFSNVFIAFHKYPPFRSNIIKRVMT
jgi:hypothetical protein